MSLVGAFLIGLAVFVVILLLGLVLANVAYLIVGWDWNFIQVLPGLLVGACLGFLGTAIIRHKNKQNAP